MTMARNADWSNDYTLFKTDAEKAPENAWLHYNAGNIVIINLNNDNLRPDVRAKMCDFAITELQKAVAIYPDYAAAHAGLTNLFVRTRQFDSAEIHGKRALALDPKNVNAMYGATARFADALDLCKKAVALNPEYGMGYGNMGKCYFSMHAYDSAIISFKHSLALPQPDVSEYAQIAISYQALGMRDSASRYENIARQHDPRFRLQ